ncbi:Txe/YoeB family addiction module toxin [Desulfomicrobium baculatum]|nr:Txe/YoeB family addiction module toxin [Desulfomicrobium baculatum]
MNSEWMGGPLSLPFPAAFPHAVFGTNNTGPELVEAVMREPFQGIGKPEPLKYLAPGVWSRRVTQEHRLVYVVRDDRVDFLQARYHY